MSRRGARLRSFLRALLGRRRFEREMDLEMAAHLEDRAADLIASGLALEAAQRQAEREFGDPVLWKELGREARGLRLVDDLRADVKFAARLLRRTPAFSVAAMLTIALGIGANTAVFSLVDTVLLKTLPVYQPGSLVFLEVKGSQGGGGGAPPYPAVEQVRQHSDVFAGVAAFAADELAVTVDGTVEQVFGQVASGNIFELLGMRAESGRLLTIDDERLDPPVAVIGYRYWQRRFGGAPSAIGRTFSYGGRVFTIVGVTPPAFHGLQPGRELDVTLPITQDRDMMRDAGAWWLDAIARLTPGTTIAQARARADTTFQSFMREHGNYGDMRRTDFDHLEAVPAGRGLDRLRVRFFAPLVVLMALAAVVLLIACVNLANLLHARGVARSRELAIRLATGAGRGRLIRQMLAETLVLFVAGGLAGVVAAIFAARGLAGFLAIGQPVELDVQLDWRLATFAVVVTLATGVLTGLWPAVRALRAAPMVAMKAGATGLAGRHGAADRVLLVGQVALSLVLTVAAMLFVTTLLNLRSIDLGFRHTRVLTMSVRPMLPDGSDAADGRAQFWQQTLERVRTIGGIQAASLSVLTPLSGRDVGKLATVAGLQPRAETDRLIHVNHVSEDYFHVFGIPVLSGRVLTTSDTAGSPKVVVINQAAARFYFSGRSPIGQSIDFDRGEQYRVVGVVADQKHKSLREPAPRFAFVSLWQPLDRNVRVTLSVTSALGTSVLARDVTAAVHSVHADTLVSDVLFVDEQIDAALVGERLLSTLGGSFATLALALAAIGLYGVLSYSVVRRRAEIGVRLALGATPSRVAWGVMRRALVDTAAGTAIGVPLAWGVARAARGLLFGVAPDAAAPYLLGGAVLGAMAVFAALGPARRASSVDPLDALREP